MKKQNWWILIGFFGLLIALVGIDQWSKFEVVQNIPLHHKVTVIPGFFELTYVRNTGMAFSLLDGIGMNFFVILTLIVIAIMLYIFFKAKDNLLRFSLVLILAGAIGNLIDRSVLGFVVDFLQFYIFGSPFAIFNIADAFISVGFVFLVLSLFKEDIDLIYQKRQSKRQKQGSSREDFSQTSKES